MEQKPQTFGEKAVGLSFNPSANKDVEYVKAIFAKAIELLNDLRNNTESYEARMAASKAIAEAQTAQMWAVKAITWTD